METQKVNHANQPYGCLMTLSRMEFFKLVYDLAENNRNFPTFNNEKKSTLKHIYRQSMSRHTQL
jgi:hypothetical protein